MISTNIKYRIHNQKINDKRYRYNTQTDSVRSKTSQMAADYISATDHIRDGSNTITIHFYTIAVVVIGRWSCSSETVIAIV